MAVGKTPIQILGVLLKRKITARHSAELNFCTLIEHMFNSKGRIPCMLKKETKNIDSLSAIVIP